ncbi:hypothetical protein [Streptomyces sp. NPDC093109]|uniref:hypothetical protein n=1 Tax=Streptomyces sp. NPDC093109 TaxID=3154977 RepID=UPI00345105CD
MDGQISGQVRAMRLLPWSSPEGKPCYLSSVDGTGYVSRLADEVESAQLAMSVELLDHADDMLADRKVTSPQLRFLATCMAESLRDVHRVAESRGARLPAPAYEEDEEVDGEGQEGGGQAGRHACDSPDEPGHAGGPAASGA